MSPARLQAAAIDVGSSANLAVESPRLDHAPRVGIKSSGPGVSRDSPSSIITSAGMLSLRAASRIASALGAWYRHYVFLLSALRKEKSHSTPTSALTCLTAAAPSGVAFNCSAKFRSII